MAMEQIYIPPVRVSTDAGDRRRKIPDRMVEKYHRAIFAIDMLGPGACGDRHYLRMAWQNVHVACNMRVNEEDFAAHDAEVERMITTMADLLDRALGYEKDKQRPLWQKQRDFLVGSLKRVRRATTLNDTEHLHFYRDMEPFGVDLHHPEFQISYKLWQGVRVELGEALNLSMMHPQEHPIVAWIHAAIRRVLWAMEHADVSKLDHYNPNNSPLHISKEDQARMLWEAVRSEIGATAVGAESKMVA